MSASPLTIVAFKYHSSVRPQTTSLFFNYPHSLSGSGIAIYVVQSANAVNASFTLDGNSTTLRNVGGLVSQNQFLYNVQMFDVQSLANAQHSLNVSLVDVDYVNGTIGPSVIRFDYATVNDTTPSVVSSTPSISPAPATPTSGSNHSK